MTQPKHNQIEPATDRHTIISTKEIVQTSSTKEHIQRKDTQSTHARGKKQHEYTT